jgi:hypothetical protein
MSANILRNIVSSVLSVDSREIILSGEAPDNLFLPNWGQFDYDCRFEESKLYYFNPSTGLKEYKLEKSSVYDGGTSLREIAHSKELQDSLFIVVKYSSCTQMQNPKEHDFDYGTRLYKSPNFKEINTKYEDEEIARWEQWIQS